MSTMGGAGGGVAAGLRPSPRRAASALALAAGAWLTFTTATATLTAGLLQRVLLKTRGLVDGRHAGKPHPEQGFHAGLGILRLAKDYGDIRLEAACLRGLSIGASTYGSIASILKNGLDKAFHADVAAAAEPIRHGNIRGRGYYH